MYLSDLKEKIASFLGVDPLDFVYPPLPELGDLSLPLFNLAKSQGKNPALLAQEQAEIMANLPESPDLFLSVKAVGPYLNFFLAPASFLEGAIIDIEQAGSNFGHSKAGQGQRVMLEYSNANTHKEYHVGHLRNLFYGDAIQRILQFNGYHAIPVSYINDFGIHVAKTLWNWQRHPEYARAAGPKGKLLGDCYSTANQNIGDSQEAKAEVSATMKAIESRQGEIYELWQETRDWSIAYFDEIYQCLGIKFEHIFYESEVIADGLKITEELLARGVLIKSQGAIIADLEAYGLGVLPIIRSDGTALYPVADLALAKLKFVDYKLQESVYVVDIRQGLYFKQLAKIFELAGEKFKISHLGYDFVTLKNGMMSSRSGNVITYDQLFAEALVRAQKEVSSRHQDWSEEKIQVVSEKLAIAALKFEMLKVSADKVITFDMNEALRFDGFTAAYLQYSGARLASLVRKSEIKSKSLDYQLLAHPKELALALCLQRFPEIILKAGEQRDASVIARYLFELAQAFNDYYHDVPVLKAEAPLAAARLALLASVRQVLENGFILLGMSYLEEM